MRIRVIGVWAMATDSAKRGDRPTDRTLRLIRTARVVLQQQIAPSMSDG